MAILKHMTHFVMSLKAEVGTRHKLSIYILNHAYVYFSMFIYIYIYIYRYCVDQHIGMDIMNI
jgi:hypothetical protein